MTVQDLETTLEGLPLADLSVRVEESSGRLVAEVVSPDFETQGDAERQQLVWEYLLEHLTDDQRVEVEFVFTMTPEEIREIEQS